MRPEHPQLTVPFPCSAEPDIKQGKPSSASKMVLQRGSQNPGIVDGQFTTGREIGLLLGERCDGDVQPLPGPARITYGVALS